MIVSAAARVLADPYMIPPQLRANPQVRDLAAQCARAVNAGRSSPLCDVSHDTCAAIISAHKHALQYGRTDWNMYMMWMYALSRSIWNDGRPHVADDHGRPAVIVPMAIPASRADYLSSVLDINMRVAAISADGSTFGDPRNALTNAARTLDAASYAEYVRITSSNKYENMAVIRLG